MGKCFTYQSIPPKDGTNVCPKDTDAKMVRRNWHPLGVGSPILTSVKSKCVPPCVLWALGIHGVAAEG